MTRRARRVQPDRTSRVAEWRGLMEDCHRAAMGAPGAPDAKALGDRAIAARDTWPWPVCWPNGLAFEVMVVTARAWSRAGTAEARRRLDPVLVTAAEAARATLAAAEAANAVQMGLPAMGGEV